MKRALVQLITYQLGNQISELDSGPFESFSKAVKMASGKYIII
ncbi:MAG: hypothetical protein ABR875_03680 [Minisyncoccia bacterium]